MEETSLSLLDRLHAPANAAAWERLLALYEPWIRGTLRRFPMQLADVDDLVQEVLTVVARRLPEFRHDGRRGAFRCWLRTISANRLGDYWRARNARAVATGDTGFLKAVADLEDPDGTLSRLWDQEHDQYVLRRLLELIEAEFKATTWQAFRRHVLEGAAAGLVATELGLSVNAVLIAKSRVLQRLREEAQGLIDDPVAFP
jgi:RNA polymerase sigma-70 factor (ECF subfamily)